MILNKGECPDRVRLSVGTGRGVNHNRVIFLLFSLLRGVRFIVQHRTKTLLLLLILLLILLLVILVLLLPHYRQHHWYHR